MSQIHSITAKSVEEQHKTVYTDNQLQHHLIRILVLRNPDQDTDFAVVYNLTATIFSSPGVGTIYKLLELVADKHGNQYILKLAILFSLDRARFTHTEQECIHEKIARAHCTFTAENTTIPTNEAEYIAFFSSIDTQIPLDIVHSQLMDSDNAEARYIETKKLLNLLIAKYEEFVSEILHLKGQIPTMKIKLDKYRNLQDEEKDNLSEDDIHRWKFIIEEFQVHESQMIQVYRCMKALRLQIQTYELMIVYWNEVI